MKAIVDRPDINMVDRDSGTSTKNSAPGVPYRTPASSPLLVSISVIQFQSLKLILQLPKRTVDRLDIGMVDRDGGDTLRHPKNPLCRADRAWIPASFSRRARQKAIGE
jgi:hypothetical protein